MIVTTGFDGKQLPSSAPNRLPGEAGVDLESLVDAARGGAQHGGDDLAGVRACWQLTAYRNSAGLDR